MKTIKLKVNILMKIRVLVNTKNTNNIYYALRAGLLLVPKVTKTATRLVTHIFTKLNLSLRNSRTACAQTDLALTMFR